jgi:hypothetical protein
VANGSALLSQGHTAGTAVSAPNGDYHNLPGRVSGEESVRVETESELFMGVRILTNKRKKRTY